jgi:CheY-like chemotaxis protein
MEKPMRVPTMVVDDQPDIRLLLKLLINKANQGLVVVGEAASGAEALEISAETDPLVVIMDEMMPGMSGLETTGQLRQTSKRQIIILCSAYLDEDLIERAREAGVVHCLAKENMSELPDLIRRAVAEA